jgi:hypothetical protein
MTPTPPAPDDRPLRPDFEAALAGYTAAERARPIAPPPGFADRVTAAAVGRWRRGWWLSRGAVGLTVLALSGVGWYATRPAPPPVNTPPIVAPQPLAPTPTVGETLSDAGEALASLSKATADLAISPTRSLFANTDVPWPAVRPPAEVTPAADSLAAVPAAARSSVEPLAGSTRRAINLFLRDTGLRASN